MRIRNKRQRIAGLVTYIENNRDGLYGSRSLREKVETKVVLVRSTGAMEKNIETVIGRRFKKHGMNWTTEGANNPLKLRTLWYNKIDWETFWRKIKLRGEFSPNKLTQPTSYLHSKNTKGGAVMTVARRALQSVTLYQPQKAYNGFTLFTPMTPVPSSTWLIDMQGRFVHRWQIPGWIRQQAVLLPNTNILFGLRDPEGPIADWPWAGGEIVEMDWDGNIVWRYAEPYMEAHDWLHLQNGNTLLQKYVPVPEDLATKVKGGIPGTERDGVMWSSALNEVSPDGKVLWEWVSYEHLDPELDAITPMCERFMWPDWNSFFELPDGNIMACSPHTSNIVIIDKATCDIKWRWGKGIISFPHNPSLLDNGNILVLDNGRYRVDFWPPDYSRVIEVNPRTNEIEWEYKEENPVDFFTSYIGGCERLPNGNTLICEGATGRFFEVTHRGEIVWEYVVPFYARHPHQARAGLSNRTYRCHRYGPDYPGLQGKKLDPEKLDLWNRLYGPDAFVPWARPTWRGTRRVSLEEETAPKEKEVPPVKYEEQKPSVAGPSQARETSSRLELLGY